MISQFDTSAASTGYVAERNLKDCRKRRNLCPSDRNIDPRQLSSDPTTKMMRAGPGVASRDKAWAVRPIVQLLGHDGTGPDVRRLSSTPPSNPGLRVPMTGRDSTLGIVGSCDCAESGTLK